MIIKAQKVPKKIISVDETLATFCYKFPQYTFFQAERLPFKRIIQMLTVAKKLEAQKMIELVDIVTAPHTKKGHGVKSVIEYYKRILNE